MAEQTNPTNYDIEDPDDIAVTLELDDGTELECGILTIFTVGSQDYIALLPYDEKGELDINEPALLYRFFEDEDENPEILNIESDEEFELAQKAFLDLL